ncbi:hypothetical protein [Patulibacter defluvii]|uniref:hypothetical protein n=1 Tax=Patulibacter defluvii TaxID=3095358 RepID=UPI002A749110|nr:hypothetical protein [Patulibacter sp. DM4]
MTLTIWNGIGALLLVVGSLALAYGAFLLYAPAGVLVGGAECVALGALMLAETSSKGGSS